MTPPFVTPYTVGMDSTPAKSTRQQLEKIQNFPCLYRHTVNSTYYGIKKHQGKRKEHSLQTTDRKIAERRLRDWIRGLDKVDGEAEKTTLNQLIEKFIAVRKGKADKTKQTDASIINALRLSWKYGMDIQVSKIKPSHISEWLASQEGRLFAISTLNILFD